MHANKKPIAVAQGLIVLLPKSAQMMAIPPTAEEPRPIQTQDIGTSRSSDSYSSSSSSSSSAVGT